jgi:cell wall-associated NlpC family hydrolase
VRCAVEVAAIRAAPSDDAEQVTQAVAGEPLTVEGRRDGWLRVRTAYDYPGWIRADAVADGDGELPALRDGDPVEEAGRYVGAPYEWGGLTARGIDCSGLVHIAYRRLGRLVPRNAAQQEAAAAVAEAPRAGDLVTYGDPSGRADHVAFWLGEGRILHATARDALGVVEEAEPVELQARRRCFVRLS